MSTINTGIRQFLLASAVVAAASMVSGAMASASVSTGVIDFRVRPPFRGFRAALHPSLPPDQSDDALMEAFLVDMDAAGIVLAVAMGRTAPAEGEMRARIPNADVVSLVARYPGRFVGFGSVDVRDPRAALDEIDRCAGQGLRGIAFDNPLSSPALYDDDASLLPLYERCARQRLIISLTASVMVGPDLSYSMPQHIQRVGLAFPDTPVVVPHAAWPWTMQMIAIALQGKMFGRSKVYMIPDFYLSQANAPGRSDYIDAANFGLADRILFASSYPALPLEPSVRAVEAIAFTDPLAARRILHDNAAGLFVG